MSHHCECPYCHATLAAQPIPVDSLSHYGGENGVPKDCEYGCGRPAHFSRLIGIYDLGQDRTVEWQCPDCGVRWPR